MQRERRVYRGGIIVGVSRKLIWHQANIVHTLVMIRTYEILMSLILSIVSASLGTIIFLFIGKINIFLQTESNPRIIDYYSEGRTGRPVRASLRMGSRSPDSAYLDFRSPFIVLSPGRRFDAPVT
jgi:hypothetical protein